ncbi:MAG: gamma-glutamylcyclotransferase family protein, partial [Planctomycetota bacterium]
MKPFNLFVYGTLMNPAVFRAVLGRRLVWQEVEADNVESFHPRNAVLDDYTKVSPDNTYLYAVPDPHGRIRGYLVGPLPGECMSALNKFEGKNYSRQRLRVHTKDGMEHAVVFIGHIEEMNYSFGYQFRDPLKQEILLQEKIDAALLEAEREQLHTEAELSRRAVGELHGRTIRDIVRRHFEAGGISDYAIRHSIKDKPLPDFTRIANEPTARALAQNYLSMVIRQVVFNEIEERIRKDFRYELDHMPLRQEYYERSVSSLAALRICNTHQRLLQILEGDCLTDLSFKSDHLIDFVRWSVAAADSIYEAANGKQEIEYVRNHMGRGYIPMGAELEFSNIGHAVIRDPQAQSISDGQYDGFIYFTDFALDVLTWKLGGHVDDHREKVSPEPRRGFFEIALGSLSIEANLSKPITDDPWLLNQFIHEARQFYNIRPHSVHFSLQLRRQHRPQGDRMLPLTAMKCLFAIAGDPVRDETGLLKINRLVSDEIINADPAPNMMFSDISRRHSAELDEAEWVRPGHAAGRYVQQFKFARLSPHINYEP